MTAARAFSSRSPRLAAFSYGSHQGNVRAGPLLELALPLLQCLLRGERVPKQISAEATNGERVPIRDAPGNRSDEQAPNCNGDC